MRLILVESANGRVEFGCVGFLGISVLGLVLGG
jgi:hypothetical protein